jgi:hypothetical protein
VPGVRLTKGGKIRLRLQIGSEQHKKLIARGHTIATPTLKPPPKRMTVSGDEARQRALTRRGYTARVGASKPALSVYPYTGPAGTHTVDGVTYWEDEDRARDVATSMPRSRVEKRPRGWVIILAHGKPHNVTRLRPMKGNTWADPFGDIDEFGRTRPRVREARQRRVAAKLERIVLADIEDEAVAILAAERFLVEAADKTPEPFSKSKTSNWVARAGGLPNYIQHIAHDLVEKRGKSESQAIQMAIGIVKRWCRGGGDVKPDTRAAACKAVAEWTALKAKAHAS